MKAFNVTLRLVLAAAAIYVAWSIWVQAQEPIPEAATAGETTSATPAEAHPFDSAISEAAAAINSAARRLAVGPLRYEVLGNPLWRFLVFFIILVIGFVLSRILEAFLSRHLERLPFKFLGGLGPQLADTLRKPLKYAVVLVAIRLGLASFEMADPVRDLVGKGLDILLAVLVIYTLVRSVDLLESYLRPRIEKTETRLDNQLVPILRKALKVFIVAIGIVAILERLEQPVAGIIASLGLGGLAVALAAQDTLANLFGSIAILTDRPFQVGDRVEVEGHDGPVESIGLRSTRIRTLDGTLVAIPNSKMANTVINNIARRPTIKRLYNVGVTYDTGYEKMQRALAILREIHQEAPDVEKYWVYFNGFGDSSLDILVACWSRRVVYEEYLKQQEWINLEILRRFDAEGIEIAFPTRTIWMKSEQPGLFAPGEQAPPPLA